MVRLAIRGFRLAVLLLVGYWCLLFIATHIPRPPSPGIKHFDKVLHFVAYAGLSSLLCWAFPKDRKRPYAHFFGAWLVAIAYGAMDEISQIPVGRTADYADWFADVVGAGGGLLAFAFARSLWHRYRERLLPNGLVDSIRGGTRRAFGELDFGQKP